MAGLGRYVLSVSTAALICGILTGMAENGGKKELFRLLGGVFLTIVIIQPLSRVDLDALLDLSFASRETDAAVQTKEKLAREAMADIIKAETEAYILDKAAALNASVTVEVILEERGTPIPVEAVISGEVSPYARRRLENILQTELGIAKENQRWTG